MSGGRAGASGSSARVRCAIYTRKSSEEGLEQDFNSLDAQREACAAYILSQASEGWVALPDRYDDGGISGGSLDRPALQGLLTEIAAGRVDTVVVYKVDRLTRSLLDFSKLVEAFDRAGTSFVSVTQSFNTTTSMGRLTLNMLLSFAQFEREVTAERIRDKIAASKAKGMWMGGTPPLGYRPDGRSLAVIEEHAAIVRDIFRRYLNLGNVRLVAEQLYGTGVRTPARVTASGKHFGDASFSRGQIYKILSNPVYVGDIPHRGKVHPGKHPAIVDREQWNAVQAKLADNRQGERSGARATQPSLLAGLIVDAAGEPLIASHAVKGKVRYRYYIGKQPDVGQKPTSALRIAAREIETLVVNQLAELLDDPLACIAHAHLELPVSGMQSIFDRCAEAAATVRRRDRHLVRQLVSQVRIMSDRIETDIAADELAMLLHVDQQPDAPATATIATQARLTRTGMAVRLVDPGGNAVTSATADASLVKLLAKARCWWDKLRTCDMDATQLAAAEGVSRSYLCRVVRLAFLAPDIVDAILAGRQKAGVTAAAVMATSVLEPDWRNQREVFLAAG